MNPDYENINTDDILDEVSEDVIKMFEGLFEAITPKVETDNDERDEPYI